MVMPSWVGRPAAGSQGQRPDGRPTTALHDPGDDMTKNLSGLDRSLRFLIAVGIGLLWYRGVISGTVAIVLGIVAIVFVLTSLVGWCPIYATFHMSTRRVAPGSAS
jgi:Inner membrane protein YgaP-like, transmembrane domain